MKNDQTKRNKKKKNKKERQKEKKERKIQHTSFLDQDTKKSRLLELCSASSRPGRQKQDNVSSRKSSTVDPLKQTCENISRHSASFIPRDGHRGGQN